MRARFLSLVTVVLALCWAPVAVVVGYLWILTVAAALPRRPQRQAQRTRAFRVIIPAHDEELVLEPVLHRLMAVTYPLTAFEVVVIADNCSDHTAQVARQCGARVLERTAREARGKGHALAYAFDALRGEEFDAYVVLDADTLVDPDLLTIFNRYLEAGHRVIQAHYDVLNPFDTRRTALMYVAFTLFNYVRPLGRRRLGLGTGLKGNGMCFNKAVIDRFSWKAFSLAEDIEYTTTLLLNGEQIIFAPEARVAAQMPTGRAQSTTQRLRWEAGRLQMARRDGPRLVCQGLRHFDLPLLDWGMDLVVPPLAALTLAILGGTVTAIGTATYTTTAVTRAVVTAWSALSAALLLFVVAAMVVGRLPRKAYSALLSAPWYVGWKFWIYLTMLVRRAPQSWVRTDRTRILDT